MYYLNVMFLYWTRTALNFVVLYVTMTIKIFYSILKNNVGFL